MQPLESTMHLPVPFRRYAGNAPAIAVRAETVRSALEEACARFPALAPVLLADGRLRHGIAVYVNREDVRYLQGLDTALRGGDEVRILAPASGG